jgi:MoxR-like ATPase
MMKFSPQKQKFIDSATEMFGAGSILQKKDVVAASKSAGIPTAGWFLGQMKIGYNQFKLPGESAPSTIINTPTETTASMSLIATNMEKQNLVPSVFEGFVPWGHFKDIKQIVKSGLFYPIFVTGLSGNGKTLMIEQVHADMNKELIRVNITIETDEDDLLGGFRLVNGETKFVPGPVIEAMEKGCTLLLDECDLGSNKLMCLQPVLEGKGVYLKKVNKWITPKDGFNVMATANTKGKGSEDGRFIGTNILNEAFLERFAVTIEQPYAAASVEKKIVLGSMKKYGTVDEDFADNLVTWSEVIRKTFYDGGVDELISTRRLDHIVKAFAIFKDKMKSIEMCVARFDDDTKESFMDLYTKIDAGVNPLEEVTEIPTVETTKEEEPQF